MSRWANDPERAADALIERSLDEIALRGRILLVNQGGIFPALIKERGLTYAVWNRRVTADIPATPWPPSGSFDTALVRLPKARDEQDMTAHAALSALGPGGRLILYGGNDEGIRSAAAMLEDLTGAVETLATRGHGRVLATQRRADGSFRDTLRAWQMVSPIEIAGNKRDWISYPGIFAAGRLDEGTALLLGALPALSSRARVLDYGCGSGVIGAAVQAQEPGIILDMLDSDTVALEAARENVPGARGVPGTRIPDAGCRAYAAIVSNPPLHQGVAEDHTLLERLVADAPSHLAPGGLLQIVVQRRLPLDKIFAEHFGRADVVAENGRYRVWRARRGQTVSAQ
jgi:16S rRNA (guanine1207-N2)-methyltransferase